MKILLLMLVMMAYEKKVEDAEPAECIQYIETVSACVTKLDPSIGTQFEDAIGGARKQWKGLDKKQLAAACKQAEEGFKASASAMGC